MNLAMLYKRKWLLIRLPIIGVLVLASLCIWWVGSPLPVASLVMTTGPEDGMYHVYGKRYAEKLKARGIDVTVVSSAGSADNVKRLKDSAAQFDVGFVQGGFGLTNEGGDTAASARILTLANVDIEPVWIFSKLGAIDSLLQLSGLRVSIGQTGSGSRLVALKLLEQVSLEPKDLIISESTGVAAANALRIGSIDAAIFVSAPGSEVVRAMLATPGVRLVQLKRSAALIERIPYLEPRLIAQGSLDASGKHPEQDGAILTTVASLVCRQDLHPAMQRMLVAVATEVHREAGLFSKAREFPNLRRVDFTTSHQARKTLVHGLPWIEEHLPVRVAQFIWRLLFIAVPMCLLGWLLCKAVPAYIRWTLESQVNRWYGELKYIEHDLGKPTMSGLEFAKHHQQLAGIDRALVDFSAPRDFAQRLYILRQHIDFVRQKLLGKRGR